MRRRRCVDDDAAPTTMRLRRCGSDNTAPTIANNTSPMMRRQQCGDDGGIAGRGTGSPRARPPTLGPDRGGPPLPPGARRAGRRGRAGAARHLRDHASMAGGCRPRPHSRRDRERRPGCGIPGGSAPPRSATPQAGSPDRAALPGGMTAMACHLLTTAGRSRRRRLCLRPARHAGTCR